MLTVTNDASQAIEGILQQAPEAAGIRLASAADENSGGAALSLTVADGPEPSDQVIESEGGSLFIEQTASELLDDKTLDASVTGEAVQFEILAQAA